jgi:hypothetical protein
MFVALYLLHVLAAVSVGPTLMMPFLARSPAMLTVLTFLRFSAIAILLTGIALWLALGAIHPMWLIVSFALFVVLAALFAFFVHPAADRVASDPRAYGRVLGGSIACSILTLVIVSLMVLRP